MLCLMNLDELHGRVVLWNARADELWEAMREADKAMAEAKSKWEELSNQYSTVTAYLHDLLAEERELTPMAKPVTNDPPITCPTCDAVRNDPWMPCKLCGEIDL